MVIVGRGEVCGYYGVCGDHGRGVVVMGRFGDHGRVVVIMGEVW